MSGLVEGAEVDMDCYHELGRIAGYKAQFNTYDVRIDEGGKLVYQGLKEEELKLRGETAKENDELFAKVFFRFMCVSPYFSDFLNSLTGQLSGQTRLQQG
jgi:hypothetical protein